MILIIVFTIFSSFISKSWSVMIHDQNIAHSFPKDFLFGVGSTSYQIEDECNSDSVHSHLRRIHNHQTEDTTINSYENLMDAIAAVKDLNVNFYRFSIEWSRIMPNGDLTNINENGIEQYNKMIDELLELNIEPMITMFHWDLPKTLQKLGGFTNSIIIYYFEAYANLLFERFGDRVKYWITFNEPVHFCLHGYGGVDYNAAINLSGIGEYLCVHNVLKSHAVAYHLYKNVFYKQFKGQIGLSANVQYMYSDDLSLVDRAMDFSLGWIANPIFSLKGNYPAIMRTQIASNSIREGRFWSRLPTLSDKWIHTIRGSADFLGLNYYTSRCVEILHDPVGISPSYERDTNFNRIVKPQWKKSVAGIVHSVPRGIADVLRWIKKQYNNPAVFVTENGWPDEGEEEDDERIEYLHDHLQEILNVVQNNETNLKGYTVSSLLDGFEFVAGDNITFGLYSVNLTPSSRELVPKKSANFMRNITKTHQIPSIN